MPGRCQKDRDRYRQRFRPSCAWRDGARVPRTGFVVALEGASGVGKSTLARRLARARGWEFLPEAFARLTPPPSLRYRSLSELLAIEERLLREERRRYRVARTSARRGWVVIADTGFLGPLTYTAGLVARGFVGAGAWPRVRRLAERIGAEGQLGLPDAVVYLRAPSRVRRGRAARDPRAHPPGLDRRHEAVAEFERAFYRRYYRPLAPQGFRYASAVGRVDRVVARLDALARELRRRAPARRPGLNDFVEALDRALAAGRRARSRAPAATVKKTARSGRDPSR
jgi:AAA domain